MKKVMLHPLFTVLTLIGISSGSLDAQSQKAQLYVSGTVSANENMLITVRGTKTIKGNVVIAEMNGKKTERSMDKNGRAIIDFSAIAAGLTVPTAAIIKTFDKKGNLISTATTTVQPPVVQATTAPVMDNLPANLSTGDMVKITGRNLGAEAQLVVGNQTQQVLTASDREMTVFANSATGQQSIYVSTANGVSQRQMVNIYSLDFDLSKTSILPTENVQAMVKYESIPVGTKLIFSNRSPATIKMTIPGAGNVANECIYTVTSQNGTMPVNITGLTRGDFTIALDYNFSNEPVNDDEIDYDKITKRDQLPKLIIPGYDKYSAARAIDKKSHADAMKDAFESEEAQKRWNEVFKRIYNGK